MPDWRRGALGACAPFSPARLGRRGWRASVASERVRYSPWMSLQAHLMTAHSRRWRVLGVCAWVLSALLRVRHWASALHASALLALREGVHSLTFGPQPSFGAGGIFFERPPVRCT